MSNSNVKTGQEIKYIRFDKMMGSPELKVLRKAVCNLVLTNLNSSREEILKRLVALNINPSTVKRLCGLKIEDNAVSVEIPKEVSKTIEDLGKSNLDLTKKVDGIVKTFENNLDIVKKSLEKTISLLEKEVEKLKSAAKK